jgi:L-asparaginase II
VKAVEVEFNHGGLVESEMLAEVVVIDDEFNDKVMLRVMDAVGTDIVEFDKVVA